LRIINRQGGIGDFTFFSAGLSLLEERCEVNAMPRCEGLDWVFPANVKLRVGKRGEDWNALFEHNKWRLATDRCTLAEIGLAGYYREGPVPIIRPPDEFCSYGDKTLKRLAGDMPVVAICDWAIGGGRILDPGWANECARAAWEAGYYPLAFGTETRLDYRYCDTSLVGKQTLNEALGTLLNCAALVAIDTGLACFAARMNVPLVAVYTTQLPWLRLARLPGPSVGFACAKRSVPSHYGGDFEAGDMPPLEAMKEALFGILEGKPPGKYWHNGEWFNDPLDGYYKVSARIDGPNLWDAIAALEETQAAVVTTEHITICRKADYDRAKWIARGVAYGQLPLQTLLTQDRINVLRNAALEVIDLPGDVAEVGTYKGGITRLFAETLPHKQVYGFDTFYGLPSLMHRHTLDVHTANEFEANYGEVSLYLCDLPNVALKPGVFPATAEGLEGKKFCLVHLDGDLYETTKEGLAFFWPRLVEGGIIVLDDYRWKNTPGVTMAVNEFKAENSDAVLKITAPMQATLRREYNKM